MLNRGVVERELSFGDGEAGGGGGERFAEGVEGDGRFGRVRGPESFGPPRGRGEGA